jgi:hypothetical protein
VLIHDLADVATRDIGEGTRIWQFAVVLVTCEAPGSTGDRGSLTFTEFHPRNSKA